MANQNLSFEDKLVLERRKEEMKKRLFGFEMYDEDEGIERRRKSKLFKNSKKEIKKLRYRTGIKNVEIDCDFFWIN